MNRSETPSLGLAQIPTPNHEGMPNAHPEGAAASDIAEGTSRRQFLISMGAGALTLSAAGSLAAAPAAAPKASANRGKQVRVGVVGGGFGAAFQ